MPENLLSGDAATQITQLARTNGFDLIIMPTHAGFFRRTLLGSTTAKVLNHADSPVLTTQHAETISPRQLEHREWVCAVGLDTDSERVLRYASEAAKSVRANLTLVHVIPWNVPDLRSAWIWRSASRQRKRTQRTAASRSCKALAGSHAVVRIAMGPIKHKLTEEARRLRADVLVIGRSPESGGLGR